MHCRTRVWNFAVPLSLLAVGGCAGAPSESTEVTVLEGTLQTVVVGNAERTAAHFEYFLEHEDGAWTRLLFDQRPELLHGEPGHEHLTLPGHAHDQTTAQVRLEVAGALSGDELEVAEIAVIGEADGEIGTAQNALIAASPRKVAVILANFSNNAAQPLTAAGARDLVFGGAQSSNAYFKEISFGIRSLVGKLAPTGDVFGWYTIPASNDPCNYSAWGTAARAQATSAGVDLSGYDHIVHYFPSSPACGWAGVGQVPGRYTWINGASASVIAHELGHNFGAHHSSSLSCRDATGARVPMSSTCTISEYGNPFDVMGRGYRHTTAFNKGRMGFLEPANTVSAAADGTFTIAPLEQKSTGVQSLRIPINTSQAYYVEFRQPFGFDNFTTTSSVVNGVLINRAPASYSTIERPQLIDMVPGTTTFTDASLTAGKTFTDATAGIRVTLNSLSSAGANVSVDVP